MAVSTVENSLIHLKPDEVLPPVFEETGPTEIVFDPTEGNILYVGDPAYVRERLQGDQRPVEAIVAGGIVSPAITDAHDHVVPDAASLVLRDLSVHRITDKKILLNLIQEECTQRAESGDKGWLVTRGWDTTHIELRRDDLDAVTTSLPVVVLDPSNHSGVANSQALTNIETTLKQLGHRPRGGISHDGHLPDKYASLAKDLATRAITEKELEAALESVLLSRIKNGTTAVHELMVRSSKELTVIARLKDRWERERGIPFPIKRAYLFPSVISPEPTAEIRHALETGAIDEGDITWIGIKFFADGSFGGHSAHLSQDYNDKPGNKGKATYPLTAMATILEKAAKLGIDQVAVHAIGDQAINRSLKAARKWRRIAHKHNLDPTKFRIEHFELPLPTDEILLEVADLGIWICPQSNFLTDYEYVHRLGDRVKQISPHRDFLAEDVKMMFGTDRMPASPLFAMWCAVNALFSNQRLTLEESLYHFTQTPALYEGDSRGVIGEGKKADMVIFDSSLHSVMDRSDDILERQLRGDNCKADFAETVTNLHGTIRAVYVAGQEMSRSE